MATARTHTHGTPSDMPPLVDNPYPASMTFTFAANMTPIAYGTDQNALELAAEPPTPSPFIYTPMQDEDAARNTHSKKKDAGYIPRPPNAFILFRSSFIRAQHIPEKIEGNHSALSKIIGASLFNCQFEYTHHRLFFARRKILEIPASRGEGGLGNQSHRCSRRT